MPAWPPAPAATGMRPVAPFSIALCAKRLLMTSCSVIPPQFFTAWNTSSRAPSEVMTSGTCHFSHTCMSSSSRAFERWTIWLTAKGAAGRSGLSRLCAASSSVMRWSHSSSTPEGRAFRAGKLPTIPALHWAMTSSGPETMNMGEPMMGRRSRSNGAGRGMWFSPGNMWLGGGLCRAVPGVEIAVTSTRAGFRRDRHALQCPRTARASRRPMHPTPDV